MKWMKYFGLNQKTADMAKNRLQIVIAQQRAKDSSPDYLPTLRQEILEVIAKYTKVSSDDITVELHKKNDHTSILEVNVALPES